MTPLVSIFSTVVVLNGYDAIYDALARHGEAFADKLLLWTEVKVTNHDLRGECSPFVVDIVDISAM